MENKEKATPRTLNIETNDEFKINPSERIRLLAKEKGIMLKDVAEALDIKGMVLSEWLSKKEIPPLDRLGEIADCLDTDVRYLLTGKHEHYYEEVSEENREMLKNFNELSTVRQTEVREYIKLLLKAEKSEVQQFRIKWQTGNNGI